MGVSPMLREALISFLFSGDLASFGLLAYNRGQLCNKRGSVLFEWILPCEAVFFSRHKKIEKQAPAEEACRQPVLAQSPDGVITAFNAAAARFYGYRAEEVMGRPALLFIPPAAHDAWRHITQHVLEGDCVGNYRMEHLAAKGRRLPVCLDLYPARAADSSITGVIIAHRSAGAPAMLEEARDADKWTRAIVETAVDGIITISDSGLIEYVNPAAERMFGYEAAEVVGQGVRVLMPLSFFESHEHYAEHEGSRGAGATQELSGKRKDGSTLPLELSVSEVALEDRRIFTVILHDITNRRLRQEELNKRNIELTCLYRAGEAMRSFELLSGLFQEVVRLIGPAFSYPEITRCRLTFDNDRYVSTPFSATPWRLESDITVAGRKRGEVEVFYIEERPPLDEGPFLNEERELIDAITSSLMSTIERREAEAQVIQASKLASIGELAAGVGHEINNPVNGIMNCADILAKEFAEGSKSRQFADLIRSEAERIATIVRNLLTFARQEKEHHSPARLCDIVEVVLSLSRKKIAKSHVHLEVDVPEDLPKLRCRSEQLQQVVMNLIINALHALDERYSGMNPDKILLIKAVRTELSGRPFIRFTIEDHGCGIRPAHMERLFDPFFTTKGRDVGTGLGLSISDAIVREHGGQITVESELGRYARFYVDLPLNP